MSDSWVPTPRYLLRSYGVFELLKRLPVGRVLEIGCGAGDLLLQLGRKGYEGVGVEVSAEGRALADRRIHPVRDRIRIVEGLDQVQGPFDLVIACEVLEHIQDDHAALLQWVSYLGRRGRLLISVPAHPERWGPGDEWAGHFRRYRRSDLSALTQKAGLEMESLWCYGYPLGNVSEWMDHRIHARCLREEGRKAISERTARSGIERGSEARRLSFLMQPFLMAPFCRLQLLFVDADWGHGFLLMARRQAAGLSETLSGESRLLLSVVIPAYNEAATLGKVIERIQACN